ncbi:MAG: SDR family oxidoreductase [Bacteroidota bacterium]
MNKERHIIISGIGRGIGKSLAEVFGEDGWNVWGAARTEKDLDTLQVIWEGRQYPGQLSLFQGDVSDQGVVQDWVRDVQQRTKQVQVVVHNVAQFEMGKLIEADGATLRNFIAVNALSAHYLTRALLPLLTATPGSHMFTIGSVSTTDWPAPMSAYVLSKQLLEAWHQQIRKELQPLDVATTLIRPGATLTSSWDGVAVDPETLLTPEQVANEVWRIVNYPGRADFETITIRPRAL